MHVFEIITPGSRMVYEDRMWKREIEQQFEWLQNKFFEANIALNLFLQDWQDNPPVDRHEWDAQREQDAQRHSEIRQTVQQERRIAGLPEWEDLEFETDVRFKREQWASGRIPAFFKNRISFIHARSFLYALDSFEKFLKILSETKGVPREVRNIHQKMITTFPDLLEVRNSAHHVEDRVRLIGKYKKPITLQLSNNEKIGAGPATAVFIPEGLDGSRYGTTMYDGHYGEVDVSLGSMADLQEILQAVLEAFEWDGAKRHAPSV